MDCSWRKNTIRTPRLPPARSPSSLHSVLRISRLVLANTPPMPRREGDGANLTRRFPQHVQGENVTVGFLGLVTGQAGCLVQLVTARAVSGEKRVVPITIAQKQRH